MTVIFKLWKNRNYQSAGKSYDKSQIENIYEPFDIVYKSVTEEMHAIARRQRGDKFGTWITEVIKGFKSERDKWDDPNLTEYIRNSDRLRPNFLRWVAGAYLHISYDLPRVMADNWDGSKEIGRIPYGISFHFRYRSIDSAFNTVTPYALRDKRVSGLFISRAASISDLKLLKDQISNQVDILRSDALYNAEYLAIGGVNRSYVESQMRQAAILSLKHVIDWKLWTWDRLKSFRADNLAIYLPFFPFSIDPYLIILIIAVAFWLYIRSFIRDVLLFSREFGNRLNQYMTIAVHDPENFEAYASRRSAERFEK